MTRIVRQLRGGQITIPADYRRRLGITDESLLQMTEEAGELRIKPVRVTEQAESDWIKELSQPLSIIPTGVVPTYGTNSPLTLNPIKPGKQTREDTSQRTNCCVSYYNYNRIIEIPYELSQYYLGKGTRGNIMRYASLKIYYGSPLQKLIL